MASFFYRFGLLLLLVCSIPAKGFAAEVIHSFDSLIEVAKNGELTVTERITVTAEGRKIRRGIYRDFPLLFEDAQGRERKVGFELLSVKRDGKSDGSRVEKSNESVRIYIGEKDYFLPRGKKYTYEIKYRTDRQIRFFDTHDEIFWNVTGNFWDFPILSSSGRFILPQGVAATDTIGFTGRFGSKDQNVRINQSVNTVSAFATTRLAAREGMSVAVKMPKGSINAPSEAQKSAWFWQDNINMILAGFGLVLVSLYYFVSWWMVGRDPDSGVIVPRWDAPDGMSPALINYIDNKGLAGKGFDAISSAILNLAVKGFVKIDQHDDTIKVKATENNWSSNLPVGEKSILNRLKISSGEELTISKSNGATVKKMQEGFSTAMEEEHRGKYYEHNILSLLGGIFLSIVAIACILFAGNHSQGVLGFLFVSMIATVFISTFAISFIKNITAPGNFLGKIFSLIITAFAVFTMMSTILTQIVISTVKLQSDPDTWLIIAIVGIVVLNVLFYFLLGAPTSLGRKKMDEIEGLKTYLSLAEKDRMNMKGAPDFSQEHYEDLLPYAVALGVEKPWSNAFQSWLAAAVAAGAVAAASYRPGWYSGRNFDGDRLSDTMGDFTKTMQSEFSGAMPVPKSSSSGFSGGSSGGGGGGGGGGGW